MDYNPLSLYLEKFKNILKKTSFQKETILSVISKEVNYEINPETLKIKGTTIFISGVSPVLKNEIFLHKENILKQFKDLDLNVSDIR